MQKEMECGYKKRMKEKKKKWTSVRNRIRCKSPPEKKKKKRKIKIAHVFVQLFLNPNKRNVFKRAKVELELDTLYTPI
jgi:hypothetical protein